MYLFTQILEFMMLNMVREKNVVQSNCFLLFLCKFFNENTNFCIYYNFYLYLNFTYYGVTLRNPDIK